MAKKKRGVSHAFLGAVEQDGKRVPAITEVFDNGESEQYTYDSDDDAISHYKKLLHGRSIEDEEHEAPSDFQEYKRQRAKELSGN